jgi:hypothetical protein
MDRKALLGGLAVGSGLGAGLMFLLDPNTGRRRRALASEKAGAYLRDAEEVVEKKVRHLRNRAQGLAAEVRGGVENEVDVLSAGAGRASGFGEEAPRAEGFPEEPRRRDDTTGF